MRKLHLLMTRKKDAEDLLNTIVSAMCPMAFQGQERGPWNIAMTTGASRRWHVDWDTKTSTISIWHAPRTGRTSGAKIIIGRVCRDLSCLAMPTAYGLTLCHGASHRAGTTSSPTNPTRKWLLGTSLGGTHSSMRLSPPNIP